MDARLAVPFHPHTVKEGACRVDVLNAVVVVVEPAAADDGLEVRTRVAAWIAP